MKSEEQMREDMQCKRELEWWEHYPLHKWWCNDLCPIVPRFFHRKANRYNTSHFGLHWLLFHIWTGDYFGFGIDAEVNFWNIRVGVSLPYLRITIGFTHAVYNWNWKVDNFFRRKPKAEQEQE